MSSMLHRRESIPEEIEPSVEFSRRSQNGFSSCPNPATEVNSISNETKKRKSYIAQIESEGKLEQVTVNFEGIVDFGDDPEPEEPNLFTITELLAKPFSFVSGNVHHHHRFNIFRKRSGILNVIAKQDSRCRVIGKNGEPHTQSLAAQGHKRKFFKDIFITIIDLSWSWIMTIFMATFFISWLIFAGLWYFISFENGDLEPENQLKNSTHIPCITNFVDFTSAFLFSIETQQTIGFGGRYPTEDCPSAVFMMAIQSIIGVIIQAGMAGIVFAKFTVPRNRGETIVFSKNAVISLRNSALCLMCRITDLRKSSLLDARVQMSLIQKEETEEGEIIPFQQSDLKCGTQTDGDNQAVSIFWPVTVTHKIDETSPFYNLKPSDLLASKFEIILSIVGVTEETGNTIQVRTSYLPNEILWGHRFDNDVITFDTNLNLYVINHNRINHTVNDKTPRRSAKQLDAKQSWSEKSSATISRTQSLFRVDLGSRK